MDNKTIEDGRKLKFIRERKSLSQREIAEALGITQGAYQRMEQGHTKLSKERIRQLALIYEMTEEEFNNFNLDFAEFSSSINNHIISPIHSLKKDGLVEAGQAKADLKNAILEIAALRQENELLRQLIDSKDKLIASKDKLIAFLEGQK